MDRFKETSLQHLEPELSEDYLKKVITQSCQNRVTDEGKDGQRDGWTHGQIIGTEGWT